MRKPLRWQSRKGLASPLLRLAAQRSLQEGRCIEIAVEGLALKRDLFVARSRGYPADRAQIEFWRFLKHRIEELTRLETRPTD